MSQETPNAKRVYGSNSHRLSRLRLRKEVAELQQVAAIIADGVRRSVPLVFEIIGVAFDQVVHKSSRQWRVVNGQLPVEPGQSSHSDEEKRSTPWFLPPLSRARLPPLWTRPCRSTKVHG